MRLALAVLVFAAHSAFAQCDTARGPVKSATDADVHLVDTAPVPVTIAALHELAVPRPLPQNARVMPVETTLYAVTATLLDVSLDDDGSTRLTLADDAGRTMLAAGPRPAA